MEEEMAAHCSIHAWKIPRTEELGGLQSTGSQSATTERLGTSGLQSLSVPRGPQQLGL